MNYTIENLLAERDALKAEVERLEEKLKRTRSPFRAQDAEAERDDHADMLDRISEMVGVSAFLAKHTKEQSDE